jgi:glucose/mannose transport system permease protein
MTTLSQPRHPRGPRPARVTAGRIGLYAFLLLAAAFFILPLFVMVNTSIKPMDEVRLGRIFDLPNEPTFAPWVKAWAQACTGLQCEGLSPGFWNSVSIVVPSLLLSLLVGSVTGYAMSLWRPKGANLLFAILVIGAFIPAQIFLFPLVQGLAFLRVLGSLQGIVLVHIIFSLTFMTLLFRNFYSSFPTEIFKAARIDGAGFWRIYASVVLPMSTPIMIVATIFLVTGIWNDFLFGLVFAGKEHLPMTVQLNNIVMTTFGEREYNVHMAATILAGAVPLILYFVSGRWFVRGITAGALKG